MPHSFLVNLVYQWIGGTFVHSSSSGRYKEISEAMAYFSVHAAAPTGAVAYPLRPTRFGSWSHSIGNRAKNEAMCAHN